MTDTAAGSDQRIPITLLTGFLGAGKTTLLNRVLADPDAGKIAIIVNEFGDIAIDGDLITNASDDMMEMKNGCVCCASKDDLIECLYKLFMRKVGVLQPKIDFDKIIVETTGIADPTPLAQLFYTDMQLSLTYRLDAIVTIVDAKHVVGQLENRPEARKQIAFADMMVLNKRDLVNDAELASARRAVERLNPFCPKEVTAHGELRLAQVVDLDLFDPQVKAEAIRQWIGADAEEAVQASDSHHHGHDHGHDHGTDHDFKASRGHADDVTQVCFRSDAAMDYGRLMDCLWQLTRRYGENLYRVKGVMHFRHDDRPVILQGVQQVFSPMTYAAKWPSGRPESRLVIIGRGLDVDAIRVALKGCEATGPMVFDHGLGAV